jgi:hypothetical protein
MGTSRNAAEFSRKIVSLATVTQAKQRETVMQGALVAKQIIVSEFGSRGLSPSSKIAGGKWGVGFDVKGFSNPSALVRVRGPVHLFDNPTKPHTIPGQRRRRTAKRLLLPDGGVRSSVQHPGTAGKKAFPAAKAKARIAVPRVMGQRVVGAWRNAIR